MPPALHPNPLPKQVTAAPAFQPCLAQHPYCHHFTLAGPMWRVFKSVWAGRRLRSPLGGRMRQGVIVTPTHLQVTARDGKCHFPDPVTLNYWVSGGVAGALQVA